MRQVLKALHTLHNTYRGGLNVPEEQHVYIVDMLKNSESLDDGMGNFPNFFSIPAITCCLFETFQTLSKTSYEKTVDSLEKTGYFLIIMEKNNHTLLRKSFINLLALIIVFCVYAVAPVLGAEIEIPSSFNPVGSGARAIGMGGAFIAVADDATAASWNPGGLIQLTLPEFSVVTSGFHRGEDINFGTNPEGAGSHSVSELDINYFSAAYPFHLFNRNMVVSISYQHLYDFNRKWEFAWKRPLLFSEENWNYQQTGSLSALGLSYCIQIIPQLSAGFTLNLWEDRLTDNKWEQNYRLNRLSNSPSVPSFNLTRDESYSFSGVNANFGVLWRINYKFTLGAVLKTPFKADVEHKIQESWVYKFQSVDTPGSYNDTRNEEIDMPMSYGIGVAYKFSDTLFMSADIYRTEWDDFVSRDENGKENSPITLLPVNESDIDPAHQMRMGIEYRLINEKKGYIIPIRGGIFYDPAPAEGKPDDFYGFSLGSGLTINDRFSLDIAYQYRFGNDVGKSILQIRKFSQDVDEHMVYLSVIFYPSYR